MRFHEFNRRKGLIEERDRVIAAVSGGVDSMVLLDLLMKEREAFGLTIIVAHFNFQMRGAESDEDEQLVSQRARHYGLELYVERADTREYAEHNKLGIQEAARDLRYAFFDKLLLSSGFDKIATAHNADDNAETVLMNMFRGAGVSGLAGIPIYRNDRRIIRPMLVATRNEIETYASEERVPFREDTSNAGDHYTRNFIRHHILPPVREKVNTDVVGTINRSAELFRELEGFLANTARQNFQAIVVSDSNVALHLSVPRLRGNPKLIQQYIVMIAADAFSGVKLDFVQVEMILELMEGLTGSRIVLNKDAVVFRDRDHLVFRKNENVAEFRFTVLPDHRYEFERFSFSSAIVDRAGIALNGSEYECIDVEKIPGRELVLRSWKEGDAFMPLGMRSMKKLSDFFVDEKIPVYEKASIPVLETRQGDIIWVCGYRIDERFKVTENTRRVMKLHFSTTEGTHVS